jgi:hypothetical protein
MEQFITALATATHMPEAPLVTLNRCHVFVYNMRFSICQTRANQSRCDIVIQGTQMCGDSFSNRATFTRHVRDRHADAGVCSVFALCTFRVFSDSV